MATITFALPRDSTGLAGAIRPIRQGSDFVVPTLDLASLPHQVSIAPLPAAGVFTEPWQDRYDDALATRLRAMVWSDQPGTLYLEQSVDAIVATAIMPAPLAAVANTPADSGWWPLSARYYRRRYVNGATGQAVFMLYGAYDVPRTGNHPVVGAFADRSGTITTANVSQQVAGPNMARRYLWIQNDSANAMWINFTAAATLSQPSIQLPANAIFSMERSYVSNEALNIICGTAGSAYTCKEGS